MQESSHHCPVFQTAVLSLPSGQKAFTRSKTDLISWWLYSCRLKTSACSRTHSVLLICHFSTPQQPLLELQNSKHSLPHLRS